MRVVILPKVVKPVIGREATGMSTCRALRGGWGRRASTDQSGTWEVRRGEWATVQRQTGMHNRLAAPAEVGGVRSSVEAE